MMRNAKAGNPRILFYCASNVGLGHLGRVLRIIRQLQQRLPQANILLATDAPHSVLAAQASHLATLRLPSFQFTAQETFDEKPYALDLTNRELRALRSDLLKTTVASFKPDLIYMDTLPHGKRDEMLPALKSRGNARAILCMRDIPASPEESFKFTDPKRMKKALSIYDRILIAGDAAFFNPIHEYKWPQAIAAKTRFIGFVVPPAIEPTKPDPSQQNIIAAFGGGWEATELAGAIIAAFQQIGQANANARLTIFTGPAISESSLANLRQTNPSDAIRIERYSDTFSNELARSSVAILQAGSTAFQVLETDKPLILYYRNFKDKEQEVRAKLLGRLPGIQVLNRESLSVETLANMLQDALNNPPAARKTGFCYAGIDNATKEIIAHLPPPIPEQP